MPTHASWVSTSRRNAVSMWSAASLAAADGSRRRSARAQASTVDRQCRSGSRRKASKRLEAGASKLTVWHASMSEPLWRAICFAWVHVPSMRTKRTGSGSASCVLVTSLSLLLLLHPTLSRAAPARALLSASRLMASSLGNRRSGRHPSRTASANGGSSSLKLTPSTMVTSAMHRGMSGTLAMRRFASAGCRSTSTLVLVGIG